MKGIPKGIDERHLVGDELHRIKEDGGTYNERVLDRLEFAYSVIDARPGMAARFINARERFAEPFDGFFAKADVSRFTHVVICSHSQETDLAAAQHLLNRRYSGYVGVIGSRSKAKDFRERLKAAGLPEDLISKVEIPIGLEIGAQSVPEIALSISARLTATFRPPK